MHIQIITRLAKRVSGFFSAREKHNKSNSLPIKSVHPGPAHKCMDKYYDLPKFAKVIKSKSGHDVLFYVDAESTCFNVHHVVNIDRHDGVIHADLKLTFFRETVQINETRAYLYVNEANELIAGRVVEKILDMIDAQVN